MNSQLNQIEQQIPEFLQILEVSLRSGYSLLQALEIVSKDMAAPIATDAAAILDSVRAGTSTTAALQDWIQRVPNESLALTVATLHVQFNQGGNLADKLQFLAQILAEKRKLAPVQ